MNIIVLGAGGHGKVVADILKMRGDSVVGYMDDDPALLEKEPLGLPVLGPIADYIRYPDTHLIVGIGSNRVRFHITQQVMEGEAATRWTTAIHPRASVASSTQVGAGTVIAAGAVVNPDTALGAHVIINTSSSVDHDCVIEDFVHIAPGAHLGGGV
ncbi:MAG: NeuD/PglB/VioB family sugar acetyltransferase, partial [Chloroflexota bacterium]